MTSLEMRATADLGEPQVDRTIPWFRIVPFWGVHVAAVAGVVYYGLSWHGVALALCMYLARMFFITAGYHRYFSHRTYRTSRAFQFVLAFLSQTSSQKGVLWWAAHHRQHHKRSDQIGDVHSLKLDGFYWSHIGWVLAKGTEDTNFDAVKDLARFPELRFLNRYWALPVVLLGLGLVVFGNGGESLVYGLFVSTVILWHATFSINSLAHKFGSRRYVTTDDSKNGLLLALLTCGEGWHNNHHYYPRAARQGFFWWEIDATFYLLTVLSWVGVVWDLNAPSERVLRANRIKVAAPAPPVSDAVGLALPSPADAE